MSNYTLFFIYFRLWKRRTCYILYLNMRRGVKCSVSFFYAVNIHGADLNIFPLTIFRAFYSQSSDLHEIMVIEAKKI